MVLATNPVGSVKGGRVTLPGLRRAADGFRSNESAERKMSGRPACPDAPIFAHDDDLNEFWYPDGTKGWFKLPFLPVPQGVCIRSLDVTVRVSLDVSACSGTT